ncbi:Uma2 family endonuclease [Azospirillum sp. A39]
MPDAQRKPWIPPEDYLALERAAHVRHEYVDGEIFAMVGASRRHATLVGNVFSAVRPAAKERGCEAYVSDVKVRVAAANAYYYPDVVVTCETSDADEYVVHAPAVIIEVLSPTTESVDRREKRANYQTLPSLREYLLVAQDERRVDLYRREGDGWSREVVTDGEIQLASLGLTLALDTVYE